MIKFFGGGGSRTLYLGCNSLPDKELQNGFYTRSSLGLFFGPLVLVYPAVPSAHKPLNLTSYEVFRPYQFGHRISRGHIGTKLDDQRFCL